MAKPFSERIAVAEAEVRRMFLRPQLKFGKILSLKA